MLKHLKLKNFKAWREADLELGKVTGLFGPNSAGKSSLLHFLLLLKQTRDATDRRLVLDFGGPKNLVSLGTFTDIVHGREESERVSWHLEWTLSEEMEIEDPEQPWGEPLFSGDELALQCEVCLKKPPPLGAMALIPPEKRSIDDLGQRPYVWPCRLAYQFGGAWFKLEPRSGPLLPELPELRVTNEKRFELAVDYEAADGREFRFKRLQDVPDWLPRPIKTHLFPNLTRLLYLNADFLGKFELAYENLTDSLYYLGPLREYPRREYSWAGASPSDVGQRGERTVDAILAATRDFEGRVLPGQGEQPMPFQWIIARWLEKLGLARGFDLEEIAPGSNLYRAMVQTSTSSVPIPLTDVGFGVSQVLPALVLLYYVPEGSTVMLEHPEIHLHPSVQSGLADIMLSAAKTRDIQIIVESHSEHLLRRLQRRVAEGKVAGQKVSSEDVKLYFVSHGGEGSDEAHLEDVCLNSFGEIENWPKNFFGDEMGEIAAIAKASLKRRMKQS